VTSRRADCSPRRYHPIRSARPKGSNPQPSARAALLLPAQEQDRRPVCVRGGEQFTEVGVRRDHHPVFGAGSGEHVDIGGSLHVEVADVDCVVARLSEQVGDIR
jgi:hypothetical protein